MGNKRIIFGTFTNAAGDTGGDVVTGLSRVDFFQLQHTGAVAAPTSVNTANETFPLESGTVTIVTGDGEDGIWMAIGDGVA